MLTEHHLPAADGVRLHAMSAGNAGPVILFLHGFPECWRAWHRQLPEFGREFRAFAVDLRGYNLSDKPSGLAPYALARIVDDLRQVLRIISPQTPATVVGHDWGGIAAWKLAAESPQLLHKLVIINAPLPAAFSRQLRRDPKQVFASSYAFFFQFPGIAERTLRAFGYAVLRGMIFKTTRRPEMFGPELRVSYLHAWQQPGALTASLNYYRNPANLRELLSVREDRTIEVPTLVIWGDGDRALRSSHLPELAPRVTRLELARHPTATHWIVHEEPAWVNARMRRFITPP